MAVLLPTVNSQIIYDCDRRKQTSKGMSLERTHREASHTGDVAISIHGHVHPSDVEELCFATGDTDR
jgi:hypothetical protein